jgi:hypothetical protein
MSQVFFSFFNNIFTKKRTDFSKIQFGKYNDNFKTYEQIEQFKLSIKEFENKNYLKSAEYFLFFVRDEEIKNLNFDVKTNKITFTFFQGSKHFDGQINENNVFITCEIIKIKKDNTKLYDFILRKNYEMKFSKFVLDNDILSLQLNLFIKYYNPIFLYNAFREVAVVADEIDDILENDFIDIEPINVSHINELSENEFNIKLNYFKNSYSNLKSELEKNDEINFSGARTFLIMSFVYKIHYLLSPEGSLLKVLNKIHTEFNKNDSNSKELNNKLLTLLFQLDNFTENDFKKSFIRIISTFPVVPPIKPLVIKDFIKSEIDKIHWYQDNQKKEIANSILEFIVGYCCYSFGFEPLVQELFEFFWQIIECKYFADLGIKTNYEDKKGLNFMTISQKINLLNSIYQKSYPKFYFNIKHLNLDSKYLFANTFLNDFINFDFSQQK